GEERRREEGGREEGGREACGRGHASSGAGEEVGPPRAGEAEGNPGAAGAGLRTLLYSAAMTPEARFRLLAGLSLVDGQLAPPEEAMLQRVAVGLGLEPARAVELVRGVASGADR